MTRIPDEVVDLMAGLVRDLHADHLKYDLHDRQQDFCKRTAEIVALLPEPVDPDLCEVLRLANEHSVKLSDEGARAIVAYFRGQPNA